MFFQNLLNDISAIPDENLAKIKTKLRSTCEKYYQVKLSFKYNEVIQNLSKRDWHLRAGQRQRSSYIGS